MTSSAIRCASEPSRRDAGFSLVELLVTLVVILAVMMTVGQIVIRSDLVYRQQRAHFDRRFSVATTVDLVVRMVRQAESITTDPDGNNLLDSVRIRSDWNPRDGDTTDPYEDVEFTVAGNTLFKREPADAAPVPFADGVTSMTFAYFNPAGGAVLNPLVATQNQLAFVNVTVQTLPVDGQPGLAITSGASVRRLE